VELPTVAIAPPDEAELKLQLEPVLDVRAAGALKAALLAHRGADLTLEASEVSRFGALCLQVLLAADAAWRADGKRLRIVNASPAFVESARLMASTSLLSLEAA